MRRRAWITVAVLWCIALLNYFDRLAMPTMREPIVQAIPMTDAQFGLLSSIFLWVYAVASPWCGFLADRCGRRNVIIASLLVWSIATWWTGHVHTFSGMMAARGFMGISEACYLPAALALIADYHPGSTRSLATGLHGSGLYAGGALAGLGAVAAEHLGWRNSFTVFGAVGAIYALIPILFLRDAEVRTAAAPAQTPIAPAAAVRELFSSRAFVILLLVNAVVGAANWLVYTWLPTFFRERFHLNLGEAGLSATVALQVASFAAILLGGWWADRWSRSRRRARMLVPAVGYLAAAPALFALGWTHSFGVALGGLALFGVARGFYDANLMPILRTLADERYSATGYGFLNFIGCLSGGVLTFAGGALRDAHVGLAISFEASAIGLVATAALLWVIKPRSVVSCS